MAQCFTVRLAVSIWGTTHYRRWRSGQPMDAPIRRYTQKVRPMRRKPFEAEYALLAELGLRRN
jgi:hypothetical protein